MVAQQKRKKIGLIELTREKKCHGDEKERVKKGKGRKKKRVPET